MKNYKHYVLGAFALTAALGVTACSSDNSEEIKPSDEVKGFYLQIGLDGEQTRTAVENPTEDATTEESKVTTGTLYLFDGSTLAFEKRIGAGDWSGANPSQGVTGTTNVISVSVNNVDPNKTYSVYFLANDDQAGLNVNSAPLTHVYTTDTPFAGTMAQDNKFVMFNQNDPTCKANQYTVKFTDTNKDKAHPATIDENKAIKIERMVARIDAPVVSATGIASAEAPSASQKDAQTKVDKINLVGYAISNLPKSSHVMQSWTDGGAFNMPTAVQYFQPKKDFGNEVKNGSVDFTNNAKNYVFENKAASTSDNYTAMYMKFQVTLKSDADVAKDFEDGTFYRYADSIYTSLESIMHSIGGTNPFGEGKTKDVLLGELKINEAKECAATEDELADFRKNYNIEVFHKGYCYYNVPVEYTSQKFTDNYTTLRNTIYKLTVKNIYNVGTDVPNGKPEDLKPNYYIQVSVSVNPWVLKTYDVELK